MEDNRPDPELLLKKIRQEEEKRKKEQKGKLKIFLGYAAGVGKTYAMLEAARSSLMTARQHLLWRKGWRTFRLLWLNTRESA